MPASSMIQTGFDLAPVDAVMPNVAAMTAAAIMPVPMVISPGTNVNDRAVSVMIVGVAVPIPVGMISVAITVSDRHSKADPNVHTRLGLRHARECESAKSQRDQKKSFPVHDEASVDVNEY